jgi:hypothetical protein
MKRDELKQVLKPLIKQCIKEVIFEEGVLSNIIAEVVKGTSGAQLVTEQKAKPQRRVTQKEAKTRNKKLIEQKKRLLGAVGADAYGGIDLFEGTAPMTDRQATGGPVRGPLSDVDPSDPGIDITQIPGAGLWSKLAK